MTNRKALNTDYNDPLRGIEYLKCKMCPPLMGNPFVLYCRKSRNKYQFYEN
jgi:hypothetical protein